MSGTTGWWARAALLLLATVATAVPAGAAGAAGAAEKVFDGIRYATSLHKWSVNNWIIWALPDRRCVAMVQLPEQQPFKFWGFRVVNGLDAEMFFGSIADARPQTVEVRYDSGSIRYPASVEAFSDWNAYVVPIKLEDLWAFPDELSFDVFAGGDKVTWGWTKVMGKVAEGLEKCDNWQGAH